MTNAQQVQFYTSVIRDIEQTFYSNPSSNTDDDEQCLHAHFITLVQILKLQAEKA